MSHDLAASIRQRIEAVEARIADACGAAGRDRSSVQLVAVSKTADARAVQEAYDVGLRAFAENRAQELVAKAAALPHDCEWHVIGAVQTNKVRLLAPVVSLWQTVDRVALGESIARRVPGARVLIEVNIGEEHQKAGCPVSQVDGLRDRCVELGLRVEGLMCIPPATHDPNPYFARLRTLAQRLELVHLSMGMTGDFEAAIAHGATIVRVGTAIFGPRVAANPARN